VYEQTGIALDDGGIDFKSGACKVSITSEYHL
jgi:hypothetical protein